MKDHLLKLSSAPGGQSEATSQQASESRLTPRVDLRDRFEITNAPRAGSSFAMQYVAEDNGEIRHGIDVKVDSQGNLRFNVKALGDRAKNGSGRDMFIAAMRILEQNKVSVEAIEGIWKESEVSVNTEKYKKNLEKIMQEKGKSTTTIFDREAAAKDTWTGKIASDFGFTEVASISHETNHIWVRFTKGV